MRVSMWFVHARWHETVVFIKNPLLKGFYNKRKEKTNARQLSNMWSEYRRRAAGHQRLPSSVRSYTVDGKLTRTVDSVI